MFNFSSSLRIYLCVEPTDMRKAFNGLYAIAKHQMELNPMDGSLFLFANRRRDRVKLLYRDGTGLWVLAKRLEKGTFCWAGRTAAKDPRLGGRTGKASERGRRASAIFAY